MIQREPWHKKILKVNRKEILTSAIVLIVSTLVTSLWHYFTGKSFVWESISPIEAPSIFSRLFYSALVYSTVGAYLYFCTDFYKWLYEPFRGGGRKDYREYKKLKRAIWGILTLLMCFVVVPFVVNMLNCILSFIYNIYVLALYLFPPLAISLLGYGLYRITFYMYKENSS